LSIGLVLSSKVLFKRSACGVDGEGTGSPQPGVATGRVERLGKLGVAGEAFDERDATLQFEIDPRAAQPRPRPLITHLRRPPAGCA